VSDLLTMCADCFVEWSRTAGVRPFGGGRREDPLCGYSHATPAASALEHIRRCNSKVILAPEVDVDQEGVGHHEAVAVLQTAKLRSLIPGLRLPTN